MKRKSDGGIQERNLHVHFRRGLSFSKLYMEDESLLLTRLSLSKLDPLTPVCPQALLSPFPVIQGEWGGEGTRQTARPDMCVLGMGNRVGPVNHLDLNLIHSHCHP